MPVETTLQVRRGTASQWLTTNPVLTSGEPGLETDTFKLKFGDGTTAWNALPYFVTETLSHTHIADDISDATATGKAVLKAASATEARTAIGAGTSSLALGSTASTAMPGNKTFGFSEITGQLGTAQLPPLAIVEPFVVASQAAMLALTAQRGDVAIRTDTGVTYILSSDSPATLADWKEIVASGKVTSVAGKIGAVVLTKADVGLSNVDDTADTAKPVSTAQQNALNLKANLASPTFTGTVGGITKAMVGLSAVDNTADSAKPISTATQTALNGKENSVTAGTTSQYYRGDKTWVSITKATVGLSVVDNTADLDKPISTATQTALSGKEGSIAAGTTAQFFRGDKSWQPIANIVVSSVDGGTP